MAKMRPKRASSHGRPVEQVRRLSLLNHAITKHAGGNASAFARLIAREVRTVQRWLSFESPIPEAIIQWIKEREGQ